METSVRDMFKELVAADILKFGGGKVGFHVGVTYGETFHKCFSGVETVDSFEELKDLYSLWKQYEAPLDRVGVVIWLTKKTGYLPLYWTAEQIEKDSGFEFSSLNLPPNPSDKYYRELFRKNEENYQRELAENRALE